MEVLRVNTDKRCQFVNITPGIAEVVRKSGVGSGIAVVFVPHTTAGVSINENADPDVVRDLIYTMDRAVPNSGFKHAEGNSDAHAKALMTGFSLEIIIEEGRLQLGTWQGVYFCEYDGPRSRKVYVKVLG
jgi:secondary thiamine-phosphate synthase enzyme